MLLLLVLLAIKHYVCDFILQNKWMAIGKGSVDRETWVPAVILHGWVNGLGTILVLGITGYMEWWHLGMIEVIFHAGVDRIKAVYNKNIPCNEKKYWIVLGADQLIHRIWDYVIVVGMIYIFG